MNHTKIEWCLNPDGSPGYTWNPISGCFNSCSYCYARRLANTRLEKRYLANNNVAPNPSVPVPRSSSDPDYDPFWPRFWPEKISGIKQLFHRKNKGIFVCDMSDLFGLGIPHEWTSQVLFAAKVNPWHRFYLLTKQPQNLAKWSPFPDNCWVGISITNTQQAIDAVTPMAQIEAKVKYISYEPLLEKVPCFHIMGLVDWVIIGAQTKPLVLPRREWVHEIVQTADRVGVKVFLKNSLVPLYGREWKLRQEVPQ